MDIFAHFLWTSAFYWQHPKRWIAGLIGFLPDIFAFGPFFVLALVNGTLIGGPHGLVANQAGIHALYNISHSFVVCACGLLLLFWLKRDWFWISFGWPLHILIDMFTHTEQFFPTPILWPISGFHIGSFSWGEPWFMAINYGMLAVLYVTLLIRFPGSLLRPRRKP